MKTIYQTAMGGITVLFLGAALVPSATAQTVLLTSPADFSGSEAIIDFEGLGGPVVPVVNGVLFELLRSGVAPRLNTRDSTPREFGPGGINSIDSANAVDEFGRDDLLITFPGPVNRVGFEMRTNTADDLDVTISCLSEGVVVDSFTLDTPLGSQFTFYAFEAVGTFDEVLIDAQNNSNGAWRMDNLRYEPTVKIVDIDIKPGSDPNCFNINGNGVIPVAILGSTSFDVTQIDQGSLSFGGLEVGMRGNKGPLCRVDYSDVDEYLDLVCQFEDNSDYWNPGEGEATLTGMLLDGTEIEGTDSICVVPLAE